MPNKMLIDASHPEETRVVVVRGSRVEEFDFESASRRQLRGNIYLAKVTRVEPSLQACFVDYGGNRHGFLAFSEIHPDYYQIPVADRQALIEEEERAAREAEERRSSRHQARRGRRDQSVSETAAEGEASSESQAADGDTTEHSRIEEVPHDDEAPEVLGHAGDDDHHDHDHDHDHHDDEHHDHEHHDHHAHAAFSEAAGNESGGAAEASEVMNEGGEAAPQDTRSENHDDAHDDSREDEGVEQVGGGAMEEVPERQPRRHRHYKIQEVIKRRQVLLVQVVKEERGTKGAALTTYLSLAGRYSVLMPNTSRGGGISRKITSSQDRQRLKELVEDLEVPEGMGVILRTAGASRTKPEIKRDFEYLLRLWETVRELTLKSQAPALVYEEGSLTKRAIRDLYNKDIDEVIVAGEEGYKEAKEFMRMLMPSHAKAVQTYREPQPMFARYGVEHQLDAMFSPTVQLKSGGYIVINPTEALVSIDVNSGRSTREHHIEDTALKTNSEAAEEIARQLRLRDLAGLIVIDFIDMEEKRNNRNVERKLKDALKHDRARIQLGRISHFGLMEMSRQRIRTGVLESSSELCPSCGGTGHVRSVSSVALQLLRAIEDQLMKSASHDLVVRAKTDVALYVLNNKRAHLRSLEEQFGVGIVIQADTGLSGQQYFVIDRGGVARPRPITAAPRISPDSVAVEYDEEEASETSETASETSNDATTHDHDHDHEHEHDHDHDHGHEHHEALERRDGRDEHGEPRGEGRGRRRRRGRRGRGGAHRDQAALQNAGDATTEESFAADEHVATPSQAGEAAPQGEPQLGPDGEPRKRRRRGRRGGRRNRRDQAPIDSSMDSPMDSSMDSSAMEPHHSGGSEFHNGSAPDLAASPGFEIPPMQREAAHFIPQEPAASPSPTMPAETPKRRSTVREPAPFVISDQNGSAASAAPSSSSEPEGNSGGGETEAERPRRSGWWSRFRGE